MKDAPTSSQQGALEGLVVLDVAGPLGNYSGKLFSDMGGDVILVEPRGGSPGRSAEPLAANGASLTFAYENAGKRSIALDLEEGRDRQTFLALAARADLVIETEKPGWLPSLGLGYPDLAARNPRLVMTSITGFGQTGPYADWETDDIVVMASSGMLSLAGYPDSTPLAAYGFQGLASAHVFAAAASMAALVAADATGMGEHVDVSAQECMVMGLENAVQFVDLEGFVRRRNGGEQPRAGTGVFACKDGFVHLMSAGVGANRFWQNTLAWMSSGGADVTPLMGSEWGQDDFLASAQAKDTFNRVFTAFAAQRCKADLSMSGQRHRVPVGPVQAPADVLLDAQLRHRNFFRPLPASLGHQAVAMPGAPYKLSQTPWRGSSLVPRPDEHGEQMRGELDAGAAAIDFGRAS